MESSNSDAPKSQGWDEANFTYLPGDLVETESGPAIIVEATMSGLQENYAVWKIPGWRWKRLPWGWSPGKSAWYCTDELKLVEPGHASKMRPKQS